VLKELSADERTRMLAEAREKAHRDEASRVDWARDEGRDEIIKLWKSGKSLDEVMREYGSN